MQTDALSEQSINFAVSVISLVKELRQNHEAILSSQIGRSGTSIGANIREAQYAQSKADFISKLQIALKEANDTQYWLELLYRTGYVDLQHYDRLKKQCVELIKILTASIKTAKN